MRRTGKSSREVAQSKLGYAPPQMCPPSRIMRASHGLPTSDGAPPEPRAVGTERASPAGYPATRAPVPWLDRPGPSRDAAEGALIARTPRRVVRRAGTFGLFPVTLSRACSPCSRHQLTHSGCIDAPSACRGRGIPRLTPRETGGKRRCPRPRERVPIGAGARGRRNPPGRNR